MKVLIIKKVDDPSAFILETVELGVPPGAVNYYGRITYGHNDGVALGIRPEDAAPFKHVLRGARELRDWLNELMPAKPTPGLDDIQKFVADPHIPNAHGDLVTVVQSDVYHGAGQPQVVVSFGDGFAWHHSRDGKGGTIRTRYLAHIEADVTLAYTDRYGSAHTQVVPVWALRPWTDKSAKPGARCNGEPEPAAA